MPCFIRYYTSDHTEHSEAFATADAVARLSSLLREQGFIYGKDVNLAEVYYGDDGRQIISFEFQDERKAMLLKLKGIENG